ncbi:hypothetical protein DFJ63DRAFT_256321 [Scheffersomyces coipomensis]|uniref:uncharacterized protein n=1 Tax=Scheffersomyces coipomensis TaxID=1788519 RepID=UPI00315D73EF
MSYKSKKSKVIRPKYHDDEENDSDDELSRTLRRDEEADNDSDDEFSTISFGALNSAQKKLLEEEKKSKSEKKSGSSNKKSRDQPVREFIDNEEDSEASENDSDDSDDDGPPTERYIRGNKNHSSKISKRSKHAPSESSSKRPVSKIREIPGLKTQRDSTLYTDVRFDAAYGKADFHKIRKDYAFLDEYRQKEIKEMESIVKDKKSSSFLSYNELEEIKLRLQSLKSRVETMKNRDLDTKILKDYKKEQIDQFKTGEKNTPFFLKRSDKRKLLQKARFDRMKSGQREKVMERKRKKRLGKEFRQLEFNRPSHS